MDIGIKLIKKFNKTIIRIIFVEIILVRNLKNPKLPFSICLANSKKGVCGSCENRCLECQAT